MGLPTVLASMLSVIAVSAMSLIGLVTLSRDEARVRRVAASLVSFAVGALLGDAFIHLIPEIFAGGGAPLPRSLLVLVGMMTFFVVEKLIRHERAGRAPAAAINLFGDGIHNFIDGIVIAASYLASPAIGLSTTLAVALHELPQELGDFGILVQSGLSPRRATVLNLASASAAVLGTALTLVGGSLVGTAVVDALLPIAAGGFVYLAAADLIPELHRDRSLRALFTQTALMTGGIAVMGLLTLVE